MNDESTNSVVQMMTSEQIARLEEPPAWANTNRPFGFPLGATAFQFTGHFHQLMGLPHPEQPIIPPVSDRNLRGRLILEEFMELLDAMGFRLMWHDNGYGSIDLTDTEQGELTIEHIEGSRYDVVETADALGDLNVVVAGTGVSFGIPMHFIDYEVYCSNLTKVDENGNPIINECPLDRQDCEDANHGYPCEHLPDPKAPIGKRLKPAGFVPTNIPRVLLAYEKKEI